ncbi:hypothetical protein ACHAWF_009003, partial [Thalassiosira exigua]
VKNPSLYAAVANHIVDLSELGEYASEPIQYSIVWVFAKTGESNPRHFWKVTDHIIRLKDLDRFKPHGLANTVWAFAKSGESHTELFYRVPHHILSLNIHEFIFMLSLTALFRLLSLALVAR